VAPSEEDIEQPDKSSTGKPSQVTSLSTEHDDTDDALDALLESKKRKIKDEREDAGSSSVSASNTEHGSLTKPKLKKGKGKGKTDADHGKVKTTKADKIKRAEHPPDLANDGDKKNDFDMIDDVN
jgi:hypothetical protein